MLIRLERFLDREGFRVPERVFVHYLDPRRRGRTFLERAGQEIYITALDLRPPLTTDDFRP